MPSIFELYLLTNEQLIDAALNKGLNFAVFRTPGSDRIHIMFGERWEEADDFRVSRGFVVAPFGKSSPFFILDPEYVREISLSDSIKSSVKSIEEEKNNCFKSDDSIDARYKSAVIKLIELHKQNGGKTVFAHQFNMQLSSVSVLPLIMQLSQEYPENFVYAWFMADKQELWIGATPELLLLKGRGKISTVSLAGTRDANIKGEWDSKNIKEQQLVTDFILSTFRKCGFNPETRKTYTKKSGQLAHICTPIDAGCRGDTDISPLLAELSPTPAVCGSDRDNALEFISTHEINPRRFFAGYCGVVFEDIVALFVTLRCASVDCTSTIATVYAGGGITGDSRPEAEWREICNKAYAIMKFLK